jgi:predicted enzyme related to lactoylglutathione lyase
MLTHMFCRYDLRTTDPEAARIFYAEVVGLHFGDPLPAGLHSMLGVWPLHEQARARGAPAHWLGQIGVPDLEVAVAQMVGLGSERLGPTVQANDGAAYATLRDQSGAVIALRTVSTMSKPPQASPVAWHHHHTRDLDRAWAAYSGCFGWAMAGTIEVATLDRL